MGFANLLNGGKRRDTVREDIDTKDINYMSAAELAKINPPLPLPLAGFFIKDGDYGKQLTVIIDDGKNDPYGVNMPKRYVDKFEDMPDDAIDAILDGKLAIGSIEGGVKTPKGVTTMVEFIDLDE